MYNTLQLDLVGGEEGLLELEPGHLVLALEVAVPERVERSLLLCHRGLGTHARVEAALGGASTWGEGGRERGREGGREGERERGGGGGGEEEGGIGADRIIIATIFQGIPPFLRHCHNYNTAQNYRTRER